MLLECLWYYKKKISLFKNKKEYKKKSFNQTDILNYIRSRTRFVDYVSFPVHWQFPCTGCCSSKWSWEQSVYVRRRCYTLWSHCPNGFWLRYTLLPPGRTGQNRRADTVHKQSCASTQTKASFQHLDTHAVRQKRKHSTDEWANMSPHRFHRSDWDQLN